jgi:hypothetical protein
MQNETPIAPLENTTPVADSRIKIAELWRTGSRGKAILLALIFCVILVRHVAVSGFFWGIVLSGVVLMAIVAAGQSWSIGFHAAWRIYKYWWMAAPLLGPSLILFGLLPVAVLKGVEWLIRRAGKPQYAETGVGLLVVCLVGIGLFIGSYYGTREDNPMLSSQPANLDALTKAVGDQSRVLGNLSESGRVLLSQLNATETELENAKKQLSVTLTNFDVQRQAAVQVTDELKRIDSRQKQIALQTEELERILEGQRPMTRQDLQRANWQGQIWGLLIGFVASLLASIAYSTFKKRKVA